MAKFGEALNRTRAKPFLKLWFVPGGQWPIKMWNGRHVQPPGLFLAFGHYEKLSSWTRGTGPGGDQEPRSLTQTELQKSSVEIIESIKDRCSFRVWKVKPTKGSWRGGGVYLQSSEVCGKTALQLNLLKHFPHEVMGPITQVILNIEVHFYKSLCFMKEDYSECLYWLMIYDWQLFLN